MFRHILEFEEEVKCGSHEQFDVLHVYINEAMMVEMTLQRVSRRQISTSVHRQMLNKVPEKQKLFQEANGMPVHLKGGVSDAVLYRATMGLTLMGTVCVIYQLVKAAVPQKKD